MILTKTVEWVGLKFVNRDLFAKDFHLHRFAACNCNCNKKSRLSGVSLRCRRGVDGDDWFDARGDVVVHYIINIPITSQSIIVHV